MLNTGTLRGLLKRNQVVNKLAIAAIFAVSSAVLAMPTADARIKMTGEEKLAKLLDGREAGTPVNCIPFARAQSATIIDNTAIVYRVGSTMYVNRPSNADRLDSDDIMVTRTSMSQLCSMETVHLHDRSFGSMWNGFVGLREFVPYKKVPTASAE